MNGVDLNSNGLNYCVRKDGGKIPWFSADYVIILRENGWYLSIEKRETGKDTVVCYLLRNFRLYISSFRIVLPTNYYRYLLSFGCTLRAGFLSSHKLLAAMFTQKTSIMQILAAKIFMGISIVKIVCECFLPCQENLPMTNVSFVILPYFSNKRSQ